MKTSIMNERTLLFFSCNVFLLGSSLHMLPPMMENIQLLNKFLLFDFHLLFRQFCFIIITIIKFT